MENDEGVLYLKPLYYFVEEYPHKREIAYRLRKPVKDAKEHSYSEECYAIVDDKENHGENKVPEKRGFYLWGFYNHQKFWINVYVGISTKGKTSDLRARILEELKDERAFIWREFCETPKVISLDPKYETVVKRALRKAGSTHVFWVAETQLPSETFEAVEYDLIEAMNPTGNRRRRTPSRVVQPEAGRILNTFREMIHAERGKPTSRLRLNYHKEFWKWVGDVEPTAP